MELTACVHRVFSVAGTLTLLQYLPYVAGNESKVFLTNPDGSEYVGQVWPGYTVRLSVRCLPENRVLTYGSGLSRLVCREGRVVVDGFAAQLDPRRRMVWDLVRHERG